LIHGARVVGILAPPQDEASRDAAREKLDSIYGKGTG
jgi:hypothetical protein